MTYELAKELKDAGFPQNTLWCFRIDNGHVRKPWVKNFTDEIMVEDRGVCAPTLTELIEACGKGFQRLDRQNLVANPDTFWALSKKVEEIGENSPYGKGDTPEEAVAKLWLALNAKN